MCRIELVFTDNLSGYYKKLLDYDTLCEEIDALTTGDTDGVDLDIVFEHLITLTAICEILRGEDDG